MGGALPDGGPFVAWTTQSAGGSKLDVYLHRTLSYARGAPVGQRQQVTPKLSPVQQARTPLGTNRILVATYLSDGARLVAVEVGGKRLAARTSQERGKLVVPVPVDVRPGGGRAQVCVVADELATRAPVRTVRQPTAHKDVERFS